MIKETYEMKIKTPSSCVARESVREIIENTPKGESIKIKTIISNKKSDGLYTVFVDDDRFEDNLFGLIKSVQKDGEDVAPELLDEMISKKNYDVVITGTQGKTVILADLNVTTEDAVTRVSETIYQDIDNLINEKIDAGIVTKEDMDERMRVLNDNHVDPFLIFRIIKRYRKYKKQVKTPSCIYIDPFLKNSLDQGEEPIISEILRSAISGNGIVFEGEKSVGKNVCAETIAWLLGMPERLFTCSRQMTTSTLYGEKTTDNSAMQALSSFDPNVLLLAQQAQAQVDGLIDIYYRLKSTHSLPDGYKNARAFVNKNLPEEFAEALKKKAEFDKMSAQAASTNIIIEDSELCDWLDDGGILVLNEMNLCEPNLLASFLNPILDGTGYLTIQGRGEVPINPDCVLIATQNADYAGVEEQNEATMSRLACERFKQPASIADLLVNAVKAKLEEDGFPDIAMDPKYIEQADNFYRKCRSSVASGYVSNAVLNIRGFVRALATVYESNGFCRLGRQIEINVLNTCPLMEAEPLHSVLSNHVTL